MTEDKGKPKRVFGGARNPDGLIKSRNNAEDRITYADGAHNPNRIIDLRDQPSNVTVTKYDPVTKKVTVNGVEIQRSGDE